EPDLLSIDVKGNAFLRNMVRIVVGTLADVGRGALEVAQVAEILASKDRTKAGKTAPAHGLELVEVRYDGIRVSSDNSTRGVGVRGLRPCHCGRARRRATTGRGGPSGQPRRHATYPRTLRFAALRHGDPAAPRRRRERGGRASRHARDGGREDQ